MKIQEIMSTNVVSVRPGTTLRQAARKMRDLGIGSLPVVEDGQLLGVITDRDICCHAIALGRSSSTRVEKVMSTDVVTCFDDQDITDAAHLMEDRHIRRLTVLNHDNNLAGILSVDDLAHGSHELAGAVLEAATPIH